MFFIMSTRPATLKSSPTIGSIQSELHRTDDAEVEEEAERGDDRERSSRSGSEPALHARGSCGRAAPAEGATNWKRNVVSPTTTLPRGFFGELHLGRRRRPSRLTTEGLDVRDAGRERDAPVMPVEEFR